MFKKISFIFLNDVYTCICGGGVYDCPKIPVKNIGSPGPGIIGGCELCNMVYKNWTWISKEQHMFLTTEIFPQPLI